MSIECVDTLVVGAGQAGLAMSEHLSNCGVQHLVLERRRIAERWRSERWDSLVANGPAWHDRFPGLEFDGVGADEFATKDQVADYFEAYASKIVPEARGQAARVRTVAEGYKAASIARANGDAERFSLLVEQYKAAPEVTRKRLWLETVQQVLAENRKVVGGDGRQLIYVPMQGATTTQPAAPAQAILPDLVSPTVEATADPARPGRQGRNAGREENAR